MRRSRESTLRFPQHGFFVSEATRRPLPVKYIADPMNENFPATGRIAAIDYGTVRIGIAVTDPDRRFASPFENYARRDQWAADMLRFKRLA